MIKLIKTMEPLILTDNGKYAGVINAVEDFINHNCHVIGVRRTNPFDGFKIGIILYASVPALTDIATIDVDLITSEDVNMDVIWDMMNDNIRKLFRDVVGTMGYWCSLNPECDKKKEKKLSLEKEIIRRHLIRRGTAMSKKYIENCFYQYSLVSYYIFRPNMRIDFLAIGDEPFDRSEFNVIRVTAPIISHLQSRDEVMRVISSQKSAFDAAIVSRIESRAKFKHSGFTMNYFECSSCVLTRTMELVYTFDIKRSIRDAMNIEE